MGQGVLKPGWILGPRGDALIFTGPIVVGLGLVWLGQQLGILDTEVPPWAFALLIVGVDVAHVYSTAFRVYLDPEELGRRPGLYLGIPLVCLLGGVLLHTQGADVFWRALAYLAVFHFVRQQWGWIAYTRRSAGEGDEDRLLDKLAIYAATLYPLLHWHTHLPRSFEWFLAGDFVSLPARIDPYVHGLHWAILITFLGRQAQRAATGRGVNLAKLQVLVTTWIAWYVGIVVLASDIAFTTLNVLSHGVPYLAVVWRIERQRWDGERGALAKLFRPRLWFVFLGLLVLAGYGEEWLWDRLVWHERPGLFPGFGPELGATLLSFVVPLLALPQATHYVLDGWIWKFRANEDVRSLLKPNRPSGLG